VTTEKCDAIAHPTGRATDVMAYTAAIGFASVAPRYRTWSAIGRAGVGLAIVTTGAWIAYTSMRGNAWFGHSFTPDQTAGARGEIPRAYSAIGD
jgi:hypothetical protein